MAVEKTSELETALRNRLETLLMDFDASWQPGSLENTIESELAAFPNDAFRCETLRELVKIDLSRSWSAGSGRFLESYLERFADLGDASSVDPDLILAEYEARKSVRHDIELKSFRARFPNRYDALCALIAESKDSGQSNPNVVRRGTVQASIDTSRLDQLRDTKASVEPPADVDLPVEFGRYRILKELGAGAMGKVYLAHDSQLDRHVALKTPSLGKSDGSDLVTRFYREARSAAKIQHRNICPVYDVGEIDGRHFISMAFIKGRCMSEFIRPQKLPPQRTSAILIQRLAVALAEAHRHDVIHRDLKPANIMIDLEKEPIVMDFGLARQMDVESRVTQSGMAVGTPAYMSPEQILGELNEVGTATDIYALGVILYELLTGRLPFSGPIAKVVYAIVHHEPTKPSTIQPGVDPRLEMICAKMMAKDRSRRFSSMDEVAAELRAFLKGSKKSGRDANDTAATPEIRTVNPPVAPATSPAPPTLTETGALNDFFAAQAGQNPLGTLVETTPRPIVTGQRPPGKQNASAHGKRTRKNAGTRTWVFGGGLFGLVAFLSGIVIYFNGGKIELDSDSNAVVQVDEDGTITVRPDAAKPTKIRPAAESSVSSSVELFNQWDHDAKDRALWRLASLSPDGNLVAFRLGGGPMTVANTSTKQKMSIPAEMKDAISIAFSADGKRIATGHADKKIRLWDTETFFPICDPFESPIEQQVPWVHLSADGSILIAMGNDHGKLKHSSTFTTWEIETRRLISRFQADTDDQRSSDSIDASEDGRRVAVKALRKGATLWDTATGKQIPVEFEIDEDITNRKRITGIDLSADGSRLAYGVLNGASSYAAILDTATGKELWNSGPQKGRVHCVQFTHDGHLLATTVGLTQAHQLSLWDVNSGTEFERWVHQYASNDEHADHIKFLSFSNNGSRLMLAGGFMPVVVWNLSGNARSNRPRARTSRWIPAPGDDSAPAIALKESPATNETSDWVELFNGRDLTGWTQVSSKVWSVRDGAITSRTKKPRERIGGWLETEKAFEDFELKFEYQLPAGGNSGVFLRIDSRRRRKGWETGKYQLEVQLLDDDSHNVSASQTTGSVFGFVAPNQSANAQSNRWHQMRIRVVGSLLTVYHNGQEITDCDLDDWNSEINDKFQYKSPGPIGFQWYGDTVQFRGVQVRELNALPSQ